MTAIFARAEVIHSPKGSEVFAHVVSPPPPAKTVRIGWTFPSNFETPDLVFKVYSTTNLSQPIQDWALLTNIPGNARSAILSADKQQEYFLMTASNYLGESSRAGQVQ